MCVHTHVSNVILLDILTHQSLSYRKLSSQESSIKSHQLFAQAELLIKAFCHAVSGTFIQKSIVKSQVLKSNSLESSISK